MIVGAPVASAGGLLVGAYSFHPDGSLSIYEKQYLHEGEERVFRAGTGGTLFPVASESVGVAICADITHPEHAHTAASNGATVYAASCFLTERGYAMDAALLERYAGEHRMIVLMSNYGSDTGGWSSAGQSVIWSEHGDLLATAPETGEALVIATRKNGKWRASIVDG